MEERNNLIEMLEEDRLRFVYYHFVKCCKLVKIRIDIDKAFGWDVLFNRCFHASNVIEQHTLLFFITQTVTGEEERE